MGPDLAHFTWVEVVWSLVALLGLLFAWSELQEAKQDREQAETVQNGLREARMVVSDGYVLRNRVKVGIFSWWLLLGLMFGLFEVPEVPRIGGLLGLVVTAAGISLISGQQATERRTLRAIVARYQQQDTVGAAADTIEHRAAIVAAQLEIVAQEAALKLRQLARDAGDGMAVDQRRSADAAERTADAAEGMHAIQSDREAS